MISELIKKEKVLVMGILNCTPDSFSDGGENFSSSDAISNGIKMVESGAHIIDIGGESTKPGAEPVETNEEIKRVISVIKGIRMVNKEILISIDTQKSEVAREALVNGADIINDVSGFSKSKMIGVASEFKCPVIVMHMKGQPASMQDNPVYENGVVEEISEFFQERVDKLKEAGIDEIVIDPGIGFGKTLKHNVDIIKNLSELKEIDCEILIGVSRKSFLGKITGSEVEDREEETISANIVSIINGARIIRVHDVKKNVKAIKVLKKLVDL